MIRFIDRIDELKILEREWITNEAKLIIIYGRRRIGKTRLILEFLKNKEGIFYIAEDVKKEIIINDLKNEISNFFNDDFLRSLEIKEWKQLFEYFCKIIPKDKRFYFVIDEFSYIVKNSPEILSVLQKYWDLFLSKTKIFIILSGSLFGLIKEKVLSNTSPLYGRRSRDIFIRKLNFKYSKEFLKMSFEDSLKTYFSIGGVPEYLLKARNYNKFEDFIKNEFLSKHGYFYNEPYFLLSQEFKELKTYFSILNAIAYGNVEPNKIANFIGLNTREIYPYLENLIRLGFIKREPNILNFKKGIYLIVDQFLDFWFNFVFKNRTLIEISKIDIKSINFNPYFGKFFELFIREEIVPVLFYNKFSIFGKWWWRDKEIDIIGLNEHTKEALFCECKWSENVNPYKICKDLIENKIPYFNWYNNERKEYIAIFAKSFKEKINEFEGRKVYCFDLNDLKKYIEK